jgi:hypothetical protein
MKGSKVFLMAAVFLGLLAVPAPAQEKQSAPPGADEKLTAWEWFAEVHPAAAGRAGYHDFLLSPGVFARARADLGDLRLYDAGNKEIPYALRIRRKEIHQEQLTAREFNRSKNPDGSLAFSIDLGEKAGQHNEIEIAAAGTDFRRRVRLEGSDTTKDWKVLLEHGQLIHFEAEGRVVDVKKLPYPPSRFRYLRVTLYPDTRQPRDEPQVLSWHMYLGSESPGEYVTQTATLGRREAVRTSGGEPGSAWLTEFGGDAPPCERLAFDVANDDFVRPFYIERINPGEPSTIITSGEWRRRAGAEKKALEIQFNEVTAQQLRLVVTDYRNPPLNITAVRYTAPAREVVFAAAPEPATPLRLYLGNPKAEPPRYDFAANLPARLEPPPARGTLESITQNPIYQPIPKPWTERWPWLIYVILSLSGLVLLAILAVLAKRAMARHDAASPEHSLS